MVFVIIIEWYHGDFGGTDEALIDFIYKYLSESNKTLLSIAYHKVAELVNKKSTRKNGEGRKKSEEKKVSATTDDMMIRKNSSPLNSVEVESVIKTQSSQLESISNGKMEVVGDTVTTSDEHNNVKSLLLACKIKYNKYNWNLND